jgi:guanosine-3',5'-bis(diphosphate) 3'-pyrophosphohydrolase
MPLELSTKHGGLPVPDSPRKIAATALIADALLFAARRHAGQRRKGADRRPYINHPVEVAHLLAVTGGLEDPTLLAAALLHDTLEDTPATADELDSRFGGAVRSLVEEVTDDKALPKGERKAGQIAAAAGYSREAKLIRIADKISNICDVTEHPPEDWGHGRRKRYLDWAEAVVERCRGVSTPLEGRFDTELHKARRVLAGGGDGG